MNIAAEIGDLFDIPSPIMLRCPYSKRASVRALLESNGYQDVKYRWSGNRGFLWVQRYLDVVPKRDVYWEVHNLLEANGYQFRYIGGRKVRR